MYYENYASSIITSFSIFCFRMKTVVIQKIVNVYFSKQTNHSMRGVIKGSFGNMIVCNNQEIYYTFFSLQNLI